MFNNAATQALPATPTALTRIASDRMTPVTAPSVFQPYSLPSAAPKRPPPRHNAATSSGNVAPMAVAGTSNTANARPNRATFTTAPEPPAAPASGTSSDDRYGSR